MIVLENHGRRFGLSHGDSVEVRIWDTNGRILSGLFPIWDATSPQAVRGFVDKNLTENSVEFGVGIYDAESKQIIARLDYDGLKIYELN